MAINLDEFWNTAFLGGKIQAIHDIYGMIEGGKDPDTLVIELAAYKNDTEEALKKAALKFRMNKSEVNMDYDSIDTL